VYDQFSQAPSTLDMVSMLLSYWKTVVYVLFANLLVYR